jgi:hypothetical protein
MNSATTRFRSAVLLRAGVFAVTALLAGAALGQPASTNLEGYAVKIFRVESGLYPFVQVYVRTFDQKMQPLVNLNELNLGIMVKGRAYDPAKAQYRVESLRNRGEAVRTVLVLDASLSMKGAPFEAALTAAARYIDSKRPQDQIAILAIRDTNEGYELVSNFERDGGALGRRLADVRCDGKKTRLYDSIGAAIQICGMTAQGGVRSTDAEYVVSCSVVVFSDGQDDGSAISREELNTRITSLDIPIPIYSVAYSKVGQEYFKNLESLSKNSFGIYYPVGQAFERMQRVVEEIQHILQNDYVITLRSYLPVDGEEHALKLGLEYPSRSGRVTYASAKFEAIEPPPVKPIQDLQARLGQAIVELPTKDPYMSSQPGAGGGGDAAGATQ